MRRQRQLHVAYTKSISLIRIAALIGRRCAGAKTLRRRRVMVPAESPKRYTHSWIGIGTDDLVKHEVEFVDGRLLSGLCRGPNLGHLDALTVLLLA